MKRIESITTTEDWTYTVHETRVNNGQQVEKITHSGEGYYLIEFIMDEETELRLYPSGIKKVCGVVELEKEKENNEQLDLDIQEFSTRVQSE